MEEANYKQCMDFITKYNKYIFKIHNKVGICIFIESAQEAQPGKDLPCLSNHSVPPPVDGGVPHGVVPVDGGALLPQLWHTVLPVVVPGPHHGAHSLRGAGPQAGEGHVVVKDDGLLTVVDALHILEGLAVGVAPVHVLHHVQVGGDALQVGGVLL